MVALSIEFNKSDYEKLYGKLTLLCKGDKFQQAIFMSGKEASKSGVTATKQGIASITTLKSTKIAEHIKQYVHGNYTGDFSVGVKISDSPRPLTDYAHTPKKPTPNRIPTVEIYKGNKKPILNSAFLAQMQSKHLGIYRRAGKERLPIKELYGPSITGIFKANEPLQEDVLKKMSEILNKRIIHHLDRLLK